MKTTQKLFEEFSAAMLLRWARLDTLNESSRLLLLGLPVLGDKSFEDGGDLLLLRAREIVGLLEKLFHSSGGSGSSLLFFLFPDQI